MTLVGLLEPTTSCWYTPRRLGAYKRRGDLTAKLNFKNFKFLFLLSV